MPLERRHARIPAAIALVAVAAFAILWVAARTPFARGLIESQLAEATGLPARVGRLRIGFFPVLGLVLSDVTIAQPPGFDETPLVEIGKLSVRLPWRSVFGGRGDLQSLNVDDATVHLRVDAGGTANWSALLAKLVAEADAGAAEAAAAADWRLGALAVARGTVDYRDAATGSAWQLTGITATASEVAPGRPFPLELQLGGVAGASTVHFAAKGEAQLDTDAGQYAAHELEYRGWLGGDPLPLAGAELTGTLREAAYASGTGEARFAGGQFKFAEIPGRFAGTLDLDEPALVANLEIATDAFEPRVSAIILGHPLPATADPAAFDALQVVLRARMQDGEFTLDPFSGRLDDTNFEGRVIPAKRFVRASLDAIDFNRYLPPAAKPAATPAARQATLETLVAPLAKLDIDAELRIGEARIAGARMRDAVLRVGPDGEGAP
jgi:AsmA protein